MKHRSFPCGPFFTFVLHSHHTLLNCAQKPTMRYANLLVHIHIQSDPFHLFYDLLTMAPMCCMGRKPPPSPDGLPSRPSTIPSPIGQSLTQNLFSSSSTVTVLSKPADIEDLMAIFTSEALLEEKEDNLKRKKSSANIKVVTVCVCPKSFSHAADFPKKADFLATYPYAN
jgi:hypothetical protein